MIVKSVARIYYRNAVNEALPIIICPEAVELLEKGEKVSVDFKNAVIETQRGTCCFSPFPEIISQIMSKGGLIHYINTKIAEQEVKN